jgi:serine/threonine protein kinase
MEYCSRGDLLDFVLQYGPFSEIDSLKMIWQILEGLDYLHSHGIAHKDLKPENIYINDQSQIKIADFGFGVRFEENQETFQMCGSLMYTPPEDILMNASDPRKSDVWDVGLILYILLTKSYPWNAKNDQELSKLIVNSALPIPANLT